MPTEINPNLYNLLPVLIFPFVVLFISIRERLDLEKTFFYASLRTVVQLFLAGYIIEYIFHLDRWYLVAAVMGIMSVIAAKSGQSRIQGAKISTLRMFSYSWIAISAGTLIDTFIVTAIILRVEPWYQPQYLIPLGGMIMGNALNSGSLSAERFISEFKKDLSRIEMLLILGRSSHEACLSVRKNSMRNALIPTLNSMFTVGLVHLPGMMTGQILGGASPTVAAKYQIIVMFMISSTVIISSYVQIMLLEKHFFSKDQRIRYGLFT